MYSTLLTLALAIPSLSTALPQSSAPSTVISLYPNPGCPGGDPQANVNPADLQDGLCHSLGRAWGSGQFILRFQGATQRLQFFEDEACTNKTLEVVNDGTTEGQCQTAEGDGWRGVVYLTYR